jgi:ribosomal protein S18 acetylase RimI-like enzyme
LLVRGLRLYIRPIEAPDTQSVAAFLARHTAPPAGIEALAAPGEGDRTPLPSGESVADAPLPYVVPAWGLLGKLLGDIVAVVSLEMTSDALRIDDLVVARELRRKWIGRAILREVEQLAVRMDRHRLVVEHAGDAEEFLRRVGFESEGERWVRNL